jgi:predicted DNA-binding WGR domain protein
LQRYNFTVEGMTAIILHRIDSVKNMRRFYWLDVQPDLFGQWCFIREWGRIGRAGQVHTVPYPTAAEAQAALALHSASNRHGGNVEDRKSENLNENNVCCGVAVEPPQSATPPFHDQAATINNDIGAT